MNDTLNFTVQDSDNPDIFFKCSIENGRMRVGLSFQNSDGTILEKTMQFSQTSSDSIIKSIKELN